MTGGGGGHGSDQACHHGERLCGSSGWERESDGAIRRVIRSWVCVLLGIGCILGASRTSFCFGRIWRRAGRALYSALGRRQTAYRAEQESRTRGQPTGEFGLEHGWSAGRTASGCFVMMDGDGGALTQ